MTADLHPNVVSMLSDMSATLHEMKATLMTIQEDMKVSPGNPPDPRESYSVQEAAELLQKNEYTIREWCRLGRINASKREERRGGSAIWSISADEVTRYRNEGLLPVDPSRNTSR